MNTLAIAVPSDINSPSDLKSISEAWETSRDSDTTEATKEDSGQHIAQQIAVALIKYAHAPEDHGVERGFFPALNDAKTIKITALRIEDSGVRFLASIDGTIRHGYVHADRNFAIQIG